MEALLVPDRSSVAYDDLAPHYDSFTEGYAYDRWLSVLEALAREHGLSGRRLLDVGCGTGKSFLPMLERGYEVVACDLSPGMVEVARSKAAGEAEVLVADMRDLPRIGTFDLITCIDDAINYLTSEDELRAALWGFARNLRPGGIAIFDANTLATFRSVYSATHAFDSDGSFFCIRGEGDPDIEPGGVSHVCIEAFSPGPGDLWRRTSSQHAHRHHPRHEVERAAADAGLDVVAALGQAPGVRMSPQPDEEALTKTVYVARRRGDRPATRG